MKTTVEENPNQTHARALLADIHRAPATAIPRREAIVTWLDAYLVRSGQKGHVMGETEADDLVALDQFLRAYNVPVSSLSAA